MKYTDIVKVIEINVSDLCNLACNFCPHSTFYPNEKNFVSLEVLHKIKEHLQEINFKGTVSLAGRGEPTLHPEFDKVLDILLTDRTWKVQVVTNGKNVQKYKNDLKRIDILGYSHNGTKNETPREELDRQFHWFSKQKSTKSKKIIIKYLPAQASIDELKYRNRAGSFDEEKTEVTRKNDFCEYIILKMFIDYDGTYRLCCDDWKVKVNLGSIFEESIKEYLTNNSILKEYRDNLLQGKRTQSPCDDCNNCISNLTDKKISSMNNLLKGNS